MVPKSWKCVETGRLFRTTEDMYMYAEKTGLADFEETTEEKKPRTPEELLADKVALKAKIAERRKARSEEEKKQSVSSEKARRTMGKETGATKEQMAKEKRLREYKLLRKEKEDAKRERERLRAEIAKDKAERKARGGKLQSVLAADGYNPAGLSASMAKSMEQEDKKAEQVQKIEAAAPRAVGESRAPALPRAEAVDKAIASLSKYKVGGDGGKALQLLMKMTKNLVEHPGEVKYRSIKLESNAFKSKIVPLVGGCGYLKGIGYKRDDALGVMAIGEEPAGDLVFLKESLAKIQDAIARYS